MIAILKEVKCISQHIKRIIHKYILYISMTCYILFFYTACEVFYEQMYKNIQIYDGLNSQATPYVAETFVGKEFEMENFQYASQVFYM